VSNPSQEYAAPIASKQELVDYLASGEKPRSEWRIGTEHEKFGFRTDDLRAPTYLGERGIKAMLEGMAQRFGWEQVYDNGNVIALLRDKASVSLEPAGQFELSAST
jgi:glutamate--cysteine ligase